MPRRRGDDHAGLGGEMLMVTRLALRSISMWADTGGVIFFFEHLAKLEVLDEVVRKILLACITACAPVVDDATASTMGIDFLTHYRTSLPYFWSSTTLMWLVRFNIGDALPRDRATKRLSVGPGLA
jgi:hypothetical protein